MRWRGKGRGPETPDKRLVADGKASGGGERERVCACGEPLIRQGLEEEEGAVQATVLDETLMAPIDTAALSIWVDHAWFVEKEEA